MKKELEKLLNELEEGATEYIDLGNSHEKGKGHGMQEVITAVREVLDRYMDPEEVQQLLPDESKSGKKLFWYPGNDPEEEYRKSPTPNGMCYKNMEAFEKGKGVCYIAEMTDKRYDYRDFIRIAYELLEQHREDPRAEGYTVERIARSLFTICDWQHPESLAAEFFDD